MIKILVSLLLVAVLKLGVLWLFAPKIQRYRDGVEPLPRSRDSVSVVENHDGRGIDSSLGFGHEVSKYSGTRQRVSLAFAVLTPERFMEGQR